MILFLSIIGIFLSVILIYFNARNYRSSLFLGLFFFLISLYGLYEYVLLYSQSEFWVRLFLFLIPILGSSLYLIGPVLFWYVRSVITDKTHFRKSDIWHLLPSAIFLISALPGVFSDSSLKYEAAKAIALDVSAIGSYHPTILSAFISYPALFLSRPLFLFFYTCAAIIMLIQFLSKQHSPLAFRGQSFMGRWLITLLGSLFILEVSHILLLFDFTTTAFNLSALLKNLQFISAIALTGLLVSPFFFPGILYGLPRPPDHLELTNKADNTIAQQTAKHTRVKAGFNKTPLEDHNSDTLISKNITSKFELEYLNHIESQIENYMKEFQPYLQHDFNMAKFSVLVNIPAHHLAYWFREEKKLTFTDFRNLWRVEHAKRLIQEGKSSELTLEAIGLLSGFNSRNTFLRAFKKTEGFSPQAYMNKTRGI